MPLVDPNASFDVAARHLFRHLSDARQLSRNPLVRRFFGADRLSQAKERAAVALVRELVVRAAERYWGCWPESSVPSEASSRRHTIVMEHCLGGRPLDEVAAQLGISMRQCYRERNDAMHRIAEYVANHEDRPAVNVRPTLDAFQLRMDRAACRVDVGDLAQALRDYDDIVAADPSVEHKIEALCKGAEALLESGGTQACEAAIARARDLVVKGVLAPDGAAETRVHLIESKLCWSTGRFDEDARALESSLRSIEPLLRGADDRVKELHAEILLEYCDRYRTRGEFAHAHERLLGVEAALASIRVPTPKRRFDAMMESWSLGAKHVQFEGAATKRLSRYESLLELAALARSFTSPKRSIRLAEAFMQFHADAGDHVSAWDWARRAIQMAEEVADRRLLADVQLVLADWISVTPQWVQAARLLQAADGHFPTGGPEWILLRGLQAEFALQTQRYGEAIALANEVEEATERMGNVRFQAAARTTIALAAHALGKRREANAQLHSALEVIDDYGTPWTRLSAYRAAATITGDRRHRRRVQEIGRSLRV